MKHRLLMTDRSRRGFTLLEVLAAAALLSTLVVLAVPCLQRINQQNDSLVTRSTAIRELRNLAAQAQVEPRASSFELSATAAAVLTEPELSVDVTPSPDSPEIETVTFQLSWLDSSGQRTRPRPLTIWRSAEDQP